MTQTFRFKQRFLVVGLAAALAGLSSISLVLAEQKLTSAEQPLQLKLTTTLNAETAHHGDHFEGILADSYQMGDKSLPEGTLFKGHVQRAHKSMPFGMPGYVVLEIDEAQLPSGVVHHFDQNGASPKSGKIVNPNARSGKKLFKDNLPYTVLSTAVSIPLQCATSMSSGLILPITLGSRVALGVAMQLAHKKQAAAAAQNQPSNSSLSTSVSQGVMQGSGLNSAYYFLTAAPEPVLTEGTVIPLHFRSHDLAGLFSAGEATTAQMDNQAKPAAADVETRVQEPVSQPTGQSSHTAPNAMSGQSASQQTSPTMPMSAHVGPSESAEPATHPAR